MSHHIAHQPDEPTELRSQSSTLASPAAGRQQIDAAGNISSQNILEPGKRYLRRAAPSPLQTSTLPTSPPNSATPTRATFNRGGSDPSSSPLAQSSSNDLPEQPRSPKERLDDLLASERSFYRSKDSSLDSFTAEGTSTSRSGGPIIDTHNTSRSVSDSVTILKPTTTSSSNSRPHMASIASSHRAEMARGTPRTSSIDSAISSISGGGHSHKGSQDLGPSDIASLVQAAGSPEAVIQHLLKEKSSQAAQNAQLWRLVDKQRAMILGLNKDLERALKDKEKYRKKLKENLAQVSNPSPVESNPGVESDAASVNSEKKAHKPAAKAATVDATDTTNRQSEQDVPDSPIDVALAPYPITPPANIVPIPSLNNMVAAEHKMPSPTQHAFQNYNPDATQGFEAGQQRRKPNEISKDLPYNATLPPSRALPAQPSRQPAPVAPPHKASSKPQPPALSLTGPSPNPNDELRAFPTPPRKAPPAPLNLSKNTEASSHLRQANILGDHSDSEYDDVLEVDEIPTFIERGRRKTREDDDRQREVIAMKEAEARSLSKKSKAKSGSKSKPTTPKESTFSTAFDSMPASPRAVPIAPPDAHLRTQFASAEVNASSLAGVLSGAQTLVSPPLMSPGLPVSPRPMDRPMNSPLPRNLSGQPSLSSPPMSPRGLAAFPSAVPLSPRAPRQPIPLPPNTPISIVSPGLPKAEPMQLVSPKPLTLSKNVPGAAASSTGDNLTSDYSMHEKNSIYRGLVTDEYPNLLLPPNALPSIDVRVASSRLKPSRASILFPKNIEEDPVFTLAVFSRSDGRELWRVEKDSASLAQLDHTLKQSAQFTAKTPDRSLFSGHAPAKVDARRAALDKYLDEIMNTQMDTTQALEICKYLSTNTMEPHAEDINPGNDSPGLGQSPVRAGPGGRSVRNGYLTKRGKNFGGWKARFFVLDGPILKYYESPGGPHLGAIKLQNAQIGKQQQQSEQSPSRDDDPDNQYRHAFLILEPKRKDSSSLVRHVLCAESDTERDMWVKALMEYVDFREDGETESNASKRQELNRNTSSGSSHIQAHAKKPHNNPQRSQGLQDVNEDLHGVSYDSTKPGSAPHNVRSKLTDTPSPPIYGHEKDPMNFIPPAQAMKNISAPKNVQVIQDAGAWGNKQSLLVPDERTKQKKRSFFGFGSKPRGSADIPDNNSPDVTTNLSQLAYEQHGPIRPAFGATLSEAVRFNHPMDVHIELPAVVYRCIEYLDAKNAALEEGIFRLSGSNVIIKQLRERFNTEGDVNLITDDQYYDIHAVASLLKLYLRELPTTILTRELHLEFLAVTELQDVESKISALNGLVHRLPRVNNLLLRYLSGFLINIINHSDTNKMTVRNVGIVFSPTLNIPAPVFALFLQQYEGIFELRPDSHGGPVEVTITAPPLAPDDIRSPRKQKFQDLPTPSYNQHTFPEHQQAPAQFPMQGRIAYDTGFTPLSQSYESQKNLSSTLAGPEYGRSANTLAGPSYEQFSNSGAYKQFSGDNSLQQPISKSKRRESSMFGMGGIGLGPRKQPSNNKLNDQRLVHDETFFD